MSSIVLMRILESAPDRYDSGMRVLTLGSVPRMQAEIAAHAVACRGARVLEIGCGTGAVTGLLLERGAFVLAIDQNSEMLDRARRRLAAAYADALQLREATACEVDAFDADGFDSVVASLSLSEMSASERTFVVRAATRVLKRGGRLVVLDEVRPARRWQRALHRAVRLPLALLTWIVTGTTTTAIADLPAELASAGLDVVTDHRSALGTLALVVAEKRGRDCP